MASSQPSITLSNCIPESTHNALITITGPRRSGKSVLLRYMLEDFYFNQFHKVIFWSPSINVPNTDFHDLPIAEEDRYDEFFEDDMLYYIDEQEKNIKEGVTKYYLMVFDDMVCENGVVQNKNTNVINKLAARGRHMNITFIMTSQSPTGLSKWTRTQVDCAIMFQWPGKHLRSLREENWVLYDLLQLIEKGSKHSFCIYNRVDDIRAVSIIK